jgi:hypothetical protein
MGACPNIVDKSLKEHGRLKCYKADADADAENHIINFVNRTLA